MTAWHEIPGNRQVFDRLLELLTAGDAVAFVGAGASAGLYPLWPQLIAQLADLAVDAERATIAEKEAWCGGRIDLLQAARQIRQRLGEGDFAEEMRRIFGPKTGEDGKPYTPIHAALARLGFRAFVTTNYDPALTAACQDACSEFLVRAFDWRQDRVTLWLQGKPAEDGELPILHAHGQYDAKDSLVLDAEDYRRAYGDERYRLLFEQLWTRERLVVVGFSFNDAWLRLIADQVLSRIDARQLSARRHVALIGLPVEDLPTVALYREQLEEPFHLRVLFYPVTRRRGPDGREESDHSALGELLQELLTRARAATAGAPAPPPPPTAPRPDPLALWLAQVREEHRRLGDGFDRPLEMRLLEQAWVEVQVRAADVEGTLLDDSAAGKHALLGRATTLDAVLALPRGEPSWNRGRWLLEGPPGAGKTTLLKHLAVRLASEGSPGKVPLFVSLARLIDAEQGLLEHATEALFLAGENGVREALEAAGREGRLVILLDGYDEVRRERRNSVLQLVRHLARDDAWSSCQLVVSSRPIGRDDALDELLPRLDLLPLAAERQGEFLECWFRSAGRATWREEAAAAQAHFQGSRGLRELASIPLYLTLLAVLWEQDVRPPGHVAALYDEIFALLLAGGHRQPPCPIQAQDDVREALRHLAHGMTEDDLWAESVARLERRLRAPQLDDIRQRLATVPAWRPDLQVFLRDVYEKTQILGPHDSRRGDWRFWHRTFREALTAEKLLEEHQASGDDALLDWARQLADGGESRWAEPLALLTGRLGEAADDLVLRLGEANPKLAVRAVAFAQGLKPETVRATLKLTGNLEERAKIFEGIPDQLGDADACLALVEQLKDRLRNGFDLFWLWWIVEEAERRWRVGSRAQEVLDRLFAHIPVPPAELFRWIDTPHGGRVELWREIPAGRGWVGAADGEENYDDERPRHRVEILKPFAMAGVPVTQEQFAAFDPGHTSYTKGASHPVDNVTWYEAVSFCRWLATLPGFAGAAPRLPVEEEWEYACRAGTETRFWRGETEEDLERVGWYDKNSGNRTHRVGEKTANRWELYDMHGNVWEWTSSSWDAGSYRGRLTDKPYPVDPAAPAADLAASPRARRVMRGGSYWDTAQWCRSACRNFRVPWFEFRVLGFRVLLSSVPSGL